MKKLLMIIALLLATQTIHAAPAVPIANPAVKSLPAAKPIEKPMVRVHLELASPEVEPLGLKVQELQADIMTKLIQSDVLVQDDPKNPLLLLRIKTIEVDSAIATFIQLAFFENAELSRNKTAVQAMTWSQASLLATSKEDFVKEVTTTALNMTEAFATDYKKAFANESK